MRNRQTRGLLATEMNQAQGETADYAAKRRILQIIRLNFSLDGATLVDEMRNSFRILSEGPFVSSSRGEPSRTALKSLPFDGRELRRAG